ncbi:TPA: sulfatase-like hydrolase/transferase, partial [Haemophilus influenzae]
FINQSMSCYLESIKYTDQFLEKLNSQLVAQNEPYSVIYFSDHGLAHYEDSNGLSLHPNNLYKQDYEIPFIMFSSDSQKVEKIKTPQSAFNFVYGFADWMGIKEKHLQGVDFFHPEKQEIKVFDWNNVVNVKELADDPAKLPEAVQ